MTHDIVPRDPDGLRRKHKLGSDFLTADALREARMGPKKSLAEGTQVIALLRDGTRQRLIWETRGQVCAWWGKRDKPIPLYTPLLFKLDAGASISKAGDPRFGYYHQGKLPDNERASPSA